MLTSNKRKLLKLAAALALLGTASFGAIAEWILVGEDSHSQIYIDRSTIRRPGNMAKMWVINNYKSAQKLSGGSSFLFLSMRSRHEYDCSDGNSRTLDISIHSARMAEGFILLTNSTAQPWESVVPGSAAALELKIACGTK